MESYVYQLFHVSMRGEMGQTDVDWGLFNSLLFVRETILKSNDNPEDFDCYRHPLNPKGHYIPTKVEIFRK
ncbi:hypothetical protein [Pectobacterium phage PcCB7V]|nr:hypothetical protein [Pectobacterium phage PcCB7V]